MIGSEIPTQALPELLSEPIAFVIEPVPWSDATFAGIFVGCFDEVDTGGFELVATVAFADEPLRLSPPPQ